MLDVHNLDQMDLNAFGNTDTRKDQTSKTR